MKKNLSIAVLSINAVIFIVLFISSIIIKCNNSLNCSCFLNILIVVSLILIAIDIISMFFLDSHCRCEENKEIYSLVKQVIIYRDGKYSEIHIEKNKKGELKQLTIK